MKNITAFTIDRKTWLRGEGAGSSKLLRQRDSKLCCLGLFSLACGLREGDIADISTLGRLLFIQKTTLPETMQWLISGLTNSSIALNLMNKNDDRVITDSERESYIIKVFASNGITVTFIN